jgi:hypothetical protein
MYDMHTTHAHTSKNYDPHICPPSAHNPAAGGPVSPPGAPVPLLSFNVIFLGSAPAVDAGEFAAVAKLGGTSSAPASDAVPLGPEAELIPRLSVVLVVDGLGRTGSVCRGGAEI